MIFLNGTFLPAVSPLRFLTLPLIFVLIFASSALGQDNFGAETIEGEVLPWLIAPEKVEDKKTDKEELENSQEEYSEEEDLAENLEGKPKPAEINLNAKDIEIDALVKTMSQHTGRNYIVDSDVKGKVTMLIQTPVSIDEALRIFDSVLLLKGFTTVPVGENVWKVIKASNAKTTTIPIVYDSPQTPSDVLVTQLVRLKHVPASEMQQAISQFVSNEGGVNTFEGTNSLILIDSAANIHRLIDLIENLDVPARDQDITIIPIEHAEAGDIAEKINDILGDEEEQQNRARGTLARNTARNTRTARGATNRRATPQNRNTNSDVGARRRLPLKVLPDDRTNALIVVADPELTVKVRALVEQLDSPLDKSSGRFYVYHLEHADAEELGEILNNLVSGATSTSSEPTQRTTGSSLSRSSNRAVNNNAANNRNAQARAATPSRGRVNFEGDVSIAPDPATNSIIINASRSDYLRLKEVIDELDVKRRQVLVEATLLEVRLSEEEGFGVELQGALGEENGGLLGQTNFGGLSNLLTNPSALSDLTLAAASTGTLTLPGGIVIPSQAALVSAFSNNTNVNVLSSPNILATDNEEAEIIVGENVPFVSSSSTDPTNLNNTFNSIERQDVGITLRITPQISRGDYVNLSIFVEISNVVADTRNSPNGPTTTIRTTETTVEVKDGQMIVTGGLIADNITKSERGVPFFKDIPFFGQLFRTDGSTQTRNNLLVFITPRIIRDQFEARETTSEYRDKIEEVYHQNNGNLGHLAKIEQGRIDNVVDQLPPEEDGIVATPVTPPNLNNKSQSALDRTKARLEQLASVERTQPKRRRPPGVSAKVKGARMEKDVGSKPTTKSEVLKLKAKPRLPNPAGVQGSSADRSMLKRPRTSSTEEKEAAETNTAPIPSSLKPLSKLEVKGVSTSIQPAEVTSDSQRFVVLKSLDPVRARLIPGVKLRGKSDTFGLVTDASNPRFFLPGRRYGHSRVRNSEFIVLGSYKSVTEASRYHPALGGPGRWEVLNKEDNASLGSRNWLKRSN